MNRIHFVYLGDTLPKYAHASIQLAERYSGLPATLIANERAIKSKLRSTDFIAVESFYDPSRFSRVREKVWYDHQFRQGFWLKTLERLFVLQQFAELQSPAPIFHAELDQLLFRSDLLLENLAQSPHRGVFLPFHSPGQAIASILYCNDSSALNSLVEFTEASGMFPNEMILLSRWAEQHPDMVFALPTVSQVLNPAWKATPQGVEEMKLSTLDGITDAMGLGIWMGGWDPRNVPLRPRPTNLKFYDANLSPGLESKMRTVRVEFSDIARGLRLVRPDSTRIQVFNLHLHSKIHAEILREPFLLTQLIESVNRETPIPIPRATRRRIGFLVFHFIEALFNRPEAVVSRAISSFNLILRRRPGSEPFLSGDTFRSIAHHVYEPDSKTFPGRKIRQGDIVFCGSDFLEDFVQSEYLEATGPIVLILGNSDRNFVDKDFISVPKHKVGSIFVQNLTQYSDRVEVLPIGLENLWRAKHGTVRHFRVHEKRSKSRRFRVMWEFSIHTNESVRSRAADTLAGCLNADRLGKMKPSDHRRALMNYGFVACPPGNGLDTHRVWEAMYSGAVPIVLRSFMAERYQDLGLPVWIVDNYSELAGISEEELERRYIEFRPKFECPALYFDYWTELLFSERAKILASNE